MSLARFQLAYSPRRPLPPCEGPKLLPFKRHKGNIHFLKLLSSSPRLDGSEGAEGGHSYVFKVRIGKKKYALKVFKFFSVEQERSSVFPTDRVKASDEIITYHSDPFYAECRAYGKLQTHEQQQQEQRTRDERRQHREHPHRLAVPCYGYLYLPAEQYGEIFSEQFGIRDWDWPEEDEDKSWREKPPFRALVKELVESKEAIVNAEEMERDLHELRNLGIYPVDLYARNYLDGKLVDFSSAMISPHWWLDSLRPLRRQRVLDEELLLFREMIREAQTDS
ncbi:hypothetical protein EJ05DRAFT_297433 [Pseudovirgaria hyperparasitica]|uniref:Protein kinase domain-containing protein n=1 Tax=Pseudovirgaria hyperparasitica TaxID=470096 RepID=A0A6A6VSF0_9PEZI|nr:uncharacterized protein EJ05DRAFT_297433 [Pseudovirgaria hyperparasitica]KAF2752520.1 hypothetical protein EJ05DRAFT_297433 [Pseudovirgaria hyperparasitica]